MQERSEQGRLVALVGVSLVLHALAFFFVSRLEHPAPLRPKPIELELAWVESQPAPVNVEPVPEVVPPPSPSPLPSQKKKQPAIVATPVEPQPPGGGGEASAPTASGPSLGTRGDLPLQGSPSLTPSAGFAMQLSPGVAEESPRGTTIRNGPGEAPDQRSLNEYTGEVLTRRLNSDLQQEAGLAQFSAGNVPPHFKRYESAMRTALPKTKIDRTPMTAGALARDVAGVLFNEGPSAEASRRVADTPLGRSVAGQNVMTPNVEDQRFRESALQLMAQTENLKERATAARLRTVLEMTTDATGALADVSIVEKSGDPRFDESVLHFSRKVARTIPDSDDKLLGTSLWRTRWQFTWEPPDVRVRLLNAWRVNAGPQAQ